MEELTPRDKALVEAITQSFKNEIKHECFLSDGSDRKIVKEFCDAVHSEGADHETYIIILRAGKSLQNVVRRLMALIAWAIVIAIAYLIVLFVAPQLFKDLVLK